jgi:hypothetical protein
VLGVDDVLDVAGSGAVGFFAVVLVVACFELPQPARSTSPATMARVTARGLKDCCITADIDLVDEATP